MQEQTQGVTGLVTEILVFLGGFLSFAAGTRIYRSNIIQDIKIWNLGRKLEKAFKEGNKKRVEELEFLLPILKLYSSRIIYQGTAIRQIAEFPNERSFEILSRRLGNKPELSDEIKTILLITLKDIAINL